MLLSLGLITIGNHLFLRQPKAGTNVGVVTASLSNTVLTKPLSVSMITFAPKVDAFLRIRINCGALMLGTIPQIISILLVSSSVARISFLVKNIFILP
jgi:hypothetical protein